jgi:Asp-tRNA(Asn)/Glu-tRNA(Gln) amidotransferase A subunit family amidase
MIDRLKQEHDNFELTFERIEKFAGQNEIKRAIEVIHTMSKLIIQPAVEEGARIMHIIMQKTKEESTDSIKTIQEHNWVVDFLKHKLQNIEIEIYPRDQQQQQLQKELEQEIKREINKFIANLRNHLFEEERVVFPLALKSDSS